jgi:hypothetical protein
MSADESTVTYKNKKYDVLTAKNGTKYFKKPYKKPDGTVGSRPYFLKGSSPEYLAKLRQKSRKSRARRSSTRSSRRQSLKKRNLLAMKNFLKHYNETPYKSERGRKIAMSRDLHNDNQKQTKSLRKYRKSPHKLDIRGVDMGEFKSVAELKKAIRKLEKE